MRRSCLTAFPGDASSLAPFTPTVVDSFGVRGKRRCVVGVVWIALLPLDGKGAGIVVAVVRHRLAGALGTRASV
jgi:hypothetical protein